MDIKKENIQYFINQESYYSPKTTIRKILPGLIIFCVPIAIFGAYSNITSVVMLPIIVVLCIGGIILLKNPINQNKFNLFMGVSGLFLSLSTLILDYKFFGGDNSEVSLKITGLILGLYIICIAVYIIITIILIRKGYYNKQKKYKNVDWIISTIMIIGIVSGKEILGIIDRNILDNVILLFFIFLALMFGCAGTLGFLKYYLAKKLKTNI
ncbi:MAG: hypothetical protein ACK5MV_00375 [Aminipila sp.]